LPQKVAEPIKDVKIDKAAEPIVAPEEAA